MHNTRQAAKDAGEKFYFTGKPCKNGHIDKRHTSNSHCVQCDKMWEQSRYARPERKEYVKSLNQKYREDPQWVEAKRNYSNSYYQMKREDLDWAAKDNERKRRRTINPDQCPALTELEYEFLIEYYAQAIELTRETGEEHHVDHIKPTSLGGEHAPWNLQVLKETDHVLKTKEDF